MQTSIQEVSSVERELEITADADELEPRLKKALRTQRAQVDLKGFRKGRVPLSLVKRMYGEALGLRIAEKFVQEAYEKEVAGRDDLDVLGRPEMTDLDYEVDGDLRAVIHFAVRPEVELKDFSEEELPKLAHEVTDEEVEEEIQTLLRNQADLTPVEDEGAEAGDFVRFDLQTLDPETDQPLIGQRDEDQAFFLDSPQVEQNPMLAELKAALLGKKAGETVRFTFAHDAAHGEHAQGETHQHRFEAHLKDVKRRELPELDDAFVREVTDGDLDDVEAFRTEVEKRLREAWDERSKELLQGQIVERMLQLHPIPVPEALVETFLDSFVEDVQRQGDGDVSENFDETHFRTVNRDEARQQAHWMLLREAVVKEEGLKATADDEDAFFEERAGGDEDITAEQLRRYYQTLPNLMDQIRQQLLSRKVFDVLAGRFQITEMEREAFEKAVGAEETEPADTETSSLLVRE